MPGFRGGEFYSVVFGEFHSAVFGDFTAVADNVRRASLFASAEGLVLRFSLDLVRQVAGHDNFELGEVTVMNVRKAIPTYNGPAVTRVAVFLVNWERPEAVMVTS